MRRSTPIWMPALVALALTACAGGGPADGGAGSSGPSGPVPALDLACADVVGEDVLADAFGPDIAEVPLTFTGAGDYYAVSQLGLAQAGALRCEWSDRGAGGPERYLQLSVLPDAADDWAALSSEAAAFQPETDAFGDASHHVCTTIDGRTSCRVDVLANGRWLDLVLGGVESREAMAAVVSAALDALRDIPDGPVPSPAIAVACAEVVTDEEVSTALGGTVALTDNPGPVQPILYHAGFLAAGGTHCYWRGSFDAVALAAHAGILPGGAAAWDDYWSEEASPRVDRAPVEGLGDAAYAGCTGTSSCFAAARTGDAWVLADVTSEASPDSRALAIELVRALLAGL
jgi:hypothetical protein